MTTEQPACGLGSLLSMTCRDRAEAFARRLQSRLHNLGLGTGSDGAPDEPPDPELQPAPPPEPPNAASAPAVTTAPPPPPPRPPLRLGSSSDSDLYYDFDLEPESPASPAEEALELVVEQQPRAAVEPESGCTSSFFGTSPGSDSSDSFGPDGFASPSSSPAWFTRRRSSPPFSYDKCNGHALPVRQNGSAHPPKENGSANLLRGNGSENQPRDYGSTRTQIENESPHSTKEELVQQKNEHESAHPLREGDSAQKILDEAFSQSVLGNESARSILMNGSAVSLVDDGSTRLHLIQQGSNSCTTERISDNITSPHEDETFSRGSDNDSSIPEDILRNSLNLESESDSERITDVINYLESVSVHEPEESDSAELTLTEIDETETESEPCPDVTSTESASLYVSQDDEIDLLPSEKVNEEKILSCSDQEGKEFDGEFTFSDNWEDRFSDYSPGETFEGNEEQQTKDESEVTHNENLTTWQTDSSYQSTFTRAANLTLECPSEVLTAENPLVEEAPNILPEIDVLSSRSFWEDDDEFIPRLTSTLIINREDNLKDDFEVPDTTNGDKTEKETGAVESKDEATENTCSCTSPPPQVICELSPDDEESDEEESSEDEDDNKLKPEPRRRPKPEDAQDEEDDEDSPRRRLRRCSSLKTGKTPPGTPHRKKIVRFADVLGLDLADVRTFLDEIPRIPSSAYDDLTDADLSLGSAANPVIADTVDSAFSAVAGPDAETTLSLSLCTPCKMLMPTFKQPGGQIDFLERIRTLYVCLENAVVNDIATSSIAGMVRVRNLDFHKSVYIRYSIDGWKTYSDLQATYVPNSCDGFSDKFSFVLFAHTLTVGQRLEFAVRFQCKGSQYWDSNRGANYGFQCLPATSSAPFMSLPSPDDRWGSFY